MRSAWNTLLAGWPRRRTAAGTAEATTSANARCSEGPGGNDGGRYATAEAGLAIFNEKAGQLVLGALVDKFGRSQVLRTVHAHIEGCVEAVTEAPFGPVELGGAHAEVESARPVRPTPRSSRTGRAGRSGPETPGPAAERGERRRRCGHGLCVPVEADDAQMGKGSATRPAWPPPPTVASRTTPQERPTKMSITSSTMTGQVLEMAARSGRVFSDCLVMASKAQHTGQLFRAHTQPLGQHCPGFSLREHGTGQVEKGTPVLLVKGLRISPCDDGNGHFEPPAGWRFGASA